MVSMQDIAEIEEHVKKHTGHPLGLVNAPMIAEFAEILTDLNKVKKKTDAFKKRWNIR